MGRPPGTGTPLAPRGIGSRGKKLWREVVAVRDFAPGERVILEEACRLADRLERLNNVLTGADDYLTITLDKSGTVATVEVGNAMAEARLALQGLRMALQQLGLDKGAAAAAAGSVKEEPGDPIDELHKRRSARGAGA